MKEHHLGKSLNYYKHCPGEETGFMSSHPTMWQSLSPSTANLMILQ